MQDIIINYAPAISIIITILAGGFAMIKRLAKLISASNLNAVCEDIKNDNGGIKTDLNALKNEIRNNKQELAELRNAYREIKEYITKVKE